LFEDDRRPAGWSVARTAWALGLSIREYREIKAGTRSPSFETWDRDVRAVRLAAGVRGGSAAAVAQGRVRVLPSRLMGCCSQHLLVQLVVGCLVVGCVLLLGGARAPGAALVGSSVCAVVAPFLSLLYALGHLETLVHTAVILASVGLVGFGLAGLGLGTGLLGRYPMALALALGTVVAGAWLILRIHAEAAPTCSAAPCFRGFEPWVQALLAFDVAFLALLFLVQARLASRSSGEPRFVDWLNRRPARGGPPF
jgi:hypothetical protein